MMKNLYQLFKEVQQGDNDAIVEITNIFKRKIDKALFQTIINEREDLKQSLILKIIEEIKKYDLDSIPGFWELQKRKSID